MTKTEKLLRELISIPSVNPAFLPAGDPKAGERRVAECLAAVTTRVGLDVELQHVLPGRPNLLARLSPSGKTRQRILLAPHLDTVNGVEAQFTPRKSNGRIFGRGACDTKGSVAAMVSSICEIAKSGRRPAQTEIVFAGLVDEENAQRGSRALAASGLKADLAIVGEPTRAQIVTAHKGDLWLQLQTRGKSAHGARPELGRNAVHQMARVVDLLETEYAARLRRSRHKTNCWAAQPSASASSMAAPSRTLCRIAARSASIAGHCPAKPSRAFAERFSHCCGGMSFMR